MSDRQITQQNFDINLGQFNETKNFLGRLDHTFSGAGSPKPQSRHGNVKLLSFFISLEIDDFNCECHENIGIEWDQTSG